MSDVGVMWFRASSLKKLQRELEKGLNAYEPDDVLGVSHWSTPVSSKQTGGVWSGARTAHKLEYSAMVLVRAG
jgi:hypothetical protein